jgi:hypothetical protein
MGLSPEQVSAVLVTKGDVDLTPILSSLPFDDIVVWNNSKRADLKVYGRYQAVKEAKHSVIFTQDDDCIVDAAAVVAAYEPGRVVCNMPAAKRSEYAAIAPGISLVGWGACFDAEAVRVPYVLDSGGNYFTSNMVVDGDSISCGPCISGPASPWPSLLTLNDTEVRHSGRFEFRAELHSGELRGLHRATPGYTGQTLYLKNTNTNTWTVTPFGSETIDGAANVSVASKATLELQSTLVSSAAGGCNWTQVQNN